MRLRTVIGQSPLDGSAVFQYGSCVYFAANKGCSGIKSCFVRVPWVVAGSHQQQQPQHAVSLENDICTWSANVSLEYETTPRSCTRSLCLRRVCSLLPHSALPAVPGTVTRDFGTRLTCQLPTLIAGCCKGQCAASDKPLPFSAVQARWRWSGWRACRPDCPCASEEASSRRSGSNQSEFAQRSQIGSRPCSSAWRVLVRKTECWW